MLEVQKEDILSSDNLWKKCVIICRITHTTNINEICKETNWSKTNKYFSSVIRFLERENYISVDRLRTPHMITIDNKKLGWFLRSGDTFVKSEDLIKITMGMKPYYYG